MPSSSTGAEHNSGQSTSVSLEAAAGRAPGEREKKRNGCAFSSWKAFLAAFLLFILVVSDVFTNSVVAGFGGAVRGRSPTAFGVVVQGIFFVIFLVLAVHALTTGVL